MQRVVGIAAILLLIAWWALAPTRSHTATESAAPHDPRTPAQAAVTTERATRATPSLAAPVRRWNAHPVRPPKVVRGEIHAATTALLEDAVERTLASCADAAAQDIDLEADLTLVDGTTTEADVLADPRADYPPALVDCVRDALASTDLTQTGDTAVVRLPLGFH